jgi:hypothetical protein
VSPSATILKIELFRTVHPDFQDAMNKIPLSLDMDALRSFVAGIEYGSFALAAERASPLTSPRGSAAQLPPSARS